MEIPPRLGVPFGKLHYGEDVLTLELQEFPGNHPGLRLIVTLEVVSVLVFVTNLGEFRTYGKGKEGHGTASEYLEKEASSTLPRIEGPP